MTIEVLFQIFRYWNKSEGPALPSSNHVFDSFSFKQFGRSLGNPFSQIAFNSDLLHNMRHFRKGNQAATFFEGHKRPHSLMYIFL